MLIPHGTVIALVDGKEWSLYRNAGTEAAPELAVMATPRLEEHNHSSSPRHTSTTGNHSGHQADEDAHSAAVTDWINREVADRKIEHLVVIAPPRALGELRHHYSKQTEQVVLAELPKDLIGRQPTDIIAALRAK